MVTGFSYFGVRNPEYAAIDFKRMKNHGATAVFLTFAEEDMEFYPGTMKELVRLAHNENLLVYMNPWGLGGVFGGESYSRFITRNPGDLQVDARGHSVPAACFNSPQFREFVKKWVEAVAFCGADVILWDEPHFYMSHWDEEGSSSAAPRETCYCHACQHKFEEKYGYPMPRARTEDVQDFREDSLIDFLSEMSRFAREKGIENDVCMLPPSFQLDDGIRDPEKVAQIQSVDVLATDPYWEYDDPEDRVKDRYLKDSKIIKTLAVKYSKQSEMWIKNFKIKAGTEHFVKLTTDISAEAGVDRILAWSYLGSAYMSFLRSDNPYLVFDLQSETFQRLNRHPEKP